MKRREAWWKTDCSRDERWSRGGKALKDRFSKELKINDDQNFFCLIGAENRNKNEQCRKIISFNRNRHSEPILKLDTPELINKYSKISYVRTMTK